MKAAKLLQDLPLLRCELMKNVLVSYLFLLEALASSESVRKLVGVIWSLESDYRLFLIDGTDVNCINDICDRIVGRKSTFEIQPSFPWSRLRFATSR